MLPAQAPTKDSCSKGLSETSRVQKICNTGLKPFNGWLCLYSTNIIEQTLTLKLTVYAIQESLRISTDTE